MTIDDLQERCNLRRGQIENALKFLAAEEVAPIRRVLFTVFTRAAMLALEALY